MLNQIKLIMNAIEYKNYGVISESFCCSCCCMYLSTKLHENCFVLPYFTFLK